MSIDFSKLKSEFVYKFEDVLKEMRDSGYKVDVVSGFRSLEEQAKIWRKGRSTAEIERKIEELKKIDCAYLARLIADAGRQPGKMIVTYAIPGLSYHNWGEAIDVLVNGDQSGSGKNYRPLAECVKKHGLTSGWYFKRPDPGHIQYCATELSVIPLKEINDHFLQGV